MPRIAPSLALVLAISLVVMTVVTWPGDDAPEVARACVLQPLAEMDACYEGTGLARERPIAGEDAIEELMRQLAMGEDVPLPETPSLATEAPTPH